MKPLPPGGAAQNSGHKSIRPTDGAHMICSYARGESSVHTAADCVNRAEECRRLAKLALRAEDWGHFLEMAQTWELLAKQHESDNQLAETLALADAIANGRHQSRKTPLESRRFRPGGFVT